MSKDRSSNEFAMGLTIVMTIGAAIILAYAAAVVGIVLFFQPMGQLYL